MNKNITKKIITGLLTLSLTAGFVYPNTANAANAKISKSKLTLTKGNSCTLKINGSSGKVTWKSSNKKIATVSQKGKITAKRVGNAKITATIKSKKWTCRITVKKKKAAAAQKPTSTQKPTVTQTPASTPKPTATSGPTGTTLPAATPKPISTPTTSVPAITEESAYQTLNSLRSIYPEGMTLTNSYYYYSPQFGNGYGCYGFAAKLSDTVFGTAKPYQTHTSFHQIKTGDNIRIGNSHSVIVLTKSTDYITIVEGNYNASVHWDRKITSASLASSGFTVYTRY